jgi:histidinol-phosphate/aromatic aminotransferase/cobyric acid decarboxylase-like protein
MMDKPKKAFHGGAFFGAIGESLRSLERADEVISADVLDAWYDPSPRVISALAEHLPWLIKTSPPTHGDGLREVIAEQRGISAESVLLGAGTSSLMFLAFPQLIDAGDRVLVFDPSYGEYAHLVENVVGGELVRFELPLASFDPDIESLIESAQKVKMVVVVNPNSPTGRVVARGDMERAVKSCPETIFWVDETYIDFVAHQSMEKLVAECDNLIISKSMSKFYGLSGLRVGYLVTSTKRVSEWERLSPPWSVGLLGQLGAIEALLDGEYYKAQVTETMQLRGELVSGLVQLGVEPVPSVTNYVFGSLPEGGVADLVAGLAARDVFIRDANNLSPRFGDEWLRIAVKDGPSQARLIGAMKELLA